MKQQEYLREETRRLCRILAHNLKTIREKRKLSQQAVADLCGLSVNEIGRIERRKIVPRLDVLEALGNGLAIPPKRLLDPYMDPASVCIPEESETLEQIRRSLTGLLSREQDHIFQLIALSLTHFRETHPQNR